VATYAIECSQVGGVFCAIPPNLTLTEGPSTACYTVTQAGVYVTSVWYLAISSFPVLVPKTAVLCCRKKLSKLINVLTFLPAGRGA
jgi:hypothetical protein